MIAVAWLLALQGVAAIPVAEPPTCARAETLRSQDLSPSVPVQHHFQNGGGQPVRLVWVDQAGGRVEVGTIEAGGYRSLRTFPGHAFVALDGDGRCRAAVRIDEVLSGTYIGTGRYRPVPIAGWHVFMDRALSPDTRPAKAALATIAAMLRQVEGALPAAALSQVRTTPIFLHEHAGPGGMFHYSPEWLTAHGRTVELVNAIEISDASLLPDLARTQPSALLHELAHGFYAKLPEADRAAVKAVYRAAMTRGLYRDVQRNDGSSGVAYASRSAVEHFAETTEAYFGENDFYPYTRAELESYDPDGAALMARLWGQAIRSPSAP